MIHGKHQGYGYGKPDESKSKVHEARETAAAAAAVANAATGADAPEENAAKAEKVRVCGNVRALALESNDNE